jgi:hypothetical protein
MPRYTLSYTMKLRVQGLKVLESTASLVFVTVIIFQQVVPQPPVGHPWYNPQVFAPARAGIYHWQQPPRKPET